MLFEHILIIIGFIYVIYTIFEFENTNKKLDIIIKYFIIPIIISIILISYIIRGL